MPLATQGTQQNQNIYPVLGGPPDMSAGLRPSWWVTKLCIPDLLLKDRLKKNKNFYSEVKSVKPFFLKPCSEKAYINIISPKSSKVSF